MKLTKARKRGQVGHSQIFSSPACHSQLSIPTGPPAGFALGKALAVSGTVRPPYGAKDLVLWLVEHQCLTTGVLGDPILALRQRTDTKGWSASADSPRF